MNRLSSWTARAGAWPRRWHRASNPSASCRKASTNSRGGAAASPGGTRRRKPLGQPRVIILPDQKQVSLVRVVRVTEPGSEAGGGGRPHQLVEPGAKGPDLVAQVMGEAGAIVTDDGMVEPEDDVPVE